MDESLKANARDMLLQCVSSKPPSKYSFFLCIKTF